MAPRSIRNRLSGNAFLGFAKHVLGLLRRAAECPTDAESAVEATNGKHNPMGSVTVRAEALSAAWRGRPWLRAEDVLALQGGPFVDIVDESGLPLGTGFVDVHEGFAVRLISSTRTAEPLSLLRTRIARAFARRRNDLLGADACRICHGEADGVPGIYVDRFGKSLVVSADTPTAERLLPLLASSLSEVSGTTDIVFWQEQGPAKFHGALLQGHQEHARFHQGRLTIQLNLLSHPVVSKLTAQFAAQREVRRWAKGNVLELYATPGGYGFQLVDAGAHHAVLVAAEGIDEAAMIEDAKRNALADKLTILPSAEGPLERITHVRENYDVVITCGPAPLTRPQPNADDRVRWTQEQSAALQMLDEGGLLIFRIAASPPESSVRIQELADAAARHKKRLQVLERIDSGLDHPSLLGVDTQSSNTVDTETFITRVSTLA